jgi:hypothetical protein
MELTRASHEPSFSRRMLRVGFLAVGVAAGGHVATAQADPAGTLPPVWIGRRLAEQADLAPGDTVSLARESTADTLERFLVAGVFPDPPSRRSRAKRLSAPSPE